MKIDLTLDCGLEVEFEPDFKFKNHSEVEKVTWTFPDPPSKIDSQLLDLESHILGDNEKN